jgi:hypothetical protein
MELLEATAVVGLPRDRSDKMERCYNSRSYRCALHMGAMLRRPKTIGFHWQGILRELSRVEVRRLTPACSLQSSGSLTRETAHFEFPTELNYFTHLNN